MPHISGPVWVNFDPEGLHSVLVSSSGFCENRHGESHTLLNSVCEIFIVFSMFFSHDIFIKFGTVRCPQNFTE